MPNSFVSFTEVKRAVPLEAVLVRYGLLESLVRKGQNLAGPCPFCNGKSARQFQVNLAKNAWYCFGCKQGGNVLDFVAKREGGSVRAAALTLDSWFELGLAEEPPPATEKRASLPSAPTPASEGPPTQENPPLTFALKTLDPHHPSLASLGIGTETIERFGAGYCSKGLLKGRLAIPIHNAEGALVAYTGLALADETPRYLFPPKFHAPREVFNLHRLAEFAAEGGPLYLLPEIGGLLRLAEAGKHAVLGLFDGSLSPLQEEAIAGALTLYERLVVVGEDFPDRTVAHLARHASVRWVPALVADSLVTELREPSLEEEEGV